MTNLIKLEQLRTKEEIIKYFKQLGKNITEEEIDALKQSYEHADENRGKLSLQQLDSIAAGGFYKLSLDGKSFSYFPDEHFKLSEHLPGINLCDVWRLDDYGFIKMVGMFKFSQFIEFTKYCDQINDKSFDVAFCTKYYKDYHGMKTILALVPKGCSFNQSIQRELAINFFGNNRFFVESQYDRMFSLFYERYSRLGMEDFEKDIRRAFPDAPGIDMVFIELSDYAHLLYVRKTSCKVFDLIRPQLANYLQCPTKKLYDRETFDEHIASLREASAITGQTTFGGVKTEPVHIPSITEDEKGSNTDAYDEALDSYGGL